MRLPVALYIGQIYNHKYTINIPQIYAIYTLHQDNDSPKHCCSWQNIRDCLKRPTHRQKNLDTNKKTENMKLYKHNQCQPYIHCNPCKHVLFIYCTNRYVHNNSHGSIFKLRCQDSHFILLLFFFFFSTVYAK